MKGGNYKSLCSRTCEAAYYLSLNTSIDVDIGNVRVSHAKIKCGLLPRELHQFKEYHHSLIVASNEQDIVNLIIPFMWLFRPSALYNSYC